MAWVKAQARREARATVEEWLAKSAPANYQWLRLGPRPDTNGLTRRHMARALAYRARHGRFISYFARFHPGVSPPACRCRAAAELRHVTVCSTNWKVMREAKEKYKIGDDNDLHRFFMGHGRKGVGITKWFPRLNTW